MARAINRLNDLAVRRAKTPGKLADGGGLYLQVASGGSRSWVYRFMLNGKEREMGLGSANDVSLAEARDKARNAHKLRAEHVDPIDARRAARAVARLGAVTFKDAAARYIASHQAGWRNAEHRRQWASTLAAYADPLIGALPVQTIDTGLVLKVLEPLWMTKTETAGRLRGRIESILDWAKVCGYRDGENPARWKGHLDKLLPAQSKVAQVRHHAALPYAELPAFMVALRAQASVAARALEFLILTAARAGEVVGATWGETNVKAAMWSVGAARMKAGKEHRVPLSRPALAILGGIEAATGAKDGLIFTGARKRGKLLPPKAMRNLLERMGHGDVTVHGFRSAFSTWAAERTTFQREVIETALAHTVGDDTERAYQRGDLFEKRRQLMTQWADFCGA